MSAKIMIETHDLTRVYGDGEEIRALDGVNLVIEAGEFMAVMGPSGSGKSTLLNIFGALDLPTSGQVWVNGQDLANLRDADGFRAKSVGFMFQLHNLLPTLTALCVTLPVLHAQTRLMLGRSLRFTVTAKE